MDFFEIWRECTRGKDESFLSAATFYLIPRWRGRGLKDAKRRFFTT